MKWSQKRSSIKALCYFYKPTEVNPRGTTTISLTTCFSNKKSLSRKSGQGMWGRLTSQHRTVLLKSVRQNRVDIHSSLNLTGRTKDKGQSVVRLLRAILLVCLFNAHRVKTRAHTHIYTVHKDRLCSHIHSEA